MRNLILFFLFFSQLVFAQCPDWTNFPSGEQDAKTLHILYRDKFKVKNYKEAYPLWDSLYRFVKLPLPNRFTHFNDGVEMLLEFVKKETDSLKRIVLINKISEVYNDNLNCNGLNSSTLSWKAYHLQGFNYNNDSIFNYLTQAIRIGGKNVLPMTLSQMTRLTVYFYKTNKFGFDSQFMLEQYASIKEIVEFNSTKKDSSRYNYYWKDVELQYEGIKEIFGCDWFKSKYQEDFIKNTEDLACLKEIRSNISNNCGEEDSFYLLLNSRIFELKKKEVLQSEQKILDSDTSSIYRKIIALRTIIEYDSTSPVKFNELELSLYKELSFSENEWVDDITRSKLIYRYAYKLFENGDFVSARYYCRKSSSFNQNWGEPYILVGIMYASSGFKCSPSTNGLGFDAQVCVWVAIDEWNIAQTVDRDYVNKAVELIRNYSKFLPSRSELAQRDIKEGTSFKVECWIQQLTRARGL